MKREIKVGILGLVAMLVFYFGFNFLKGSDFFSTVENYSVLYDNVEGLQVSNPVTFKGVTVGRVLKFVPDYATGKVQVLLNIDEKIKLTDKTQAILADDGLLGGKTIKLQIFPGKDLQPDGSLVGTVESGMIKELSSKLDPTLKNVDSLTVSLTKVIHEFENTGKILKVLLASANQTTSGVNGIVGSNAKSLSEITANAAVLTKNLNLISKNLESQISPILKNAQTVTDSLNGLQLGKTVSSLNTTIASLSSIVEDINRGQGTIGKLKTSDSLYVNLDRTAASINALLGDMKSNPRRYVHFSLFGKKDKKP